MQLRKHVITLLKIGVTVVGMALVLRQIDPADIGRAMLHADWRWLLATVLIFNASLVLRAFRWLLLLHGLQTPVCFGRLVELYFVGNFFNSFLPTSFGGDVVRAWEVREDAPAGIAAGTVLLDRVLGLASLLVMSLFVLPFRPENFPARLIPLVVLLALGGLAATFLLLEGRLLRHLSGWLPGPLSPAGEGFVGQMMTAVQVCGRRAIAAAIGVSFLFNLMLVAWWWASARALGLDISAGYLLLVIPILSIVLLIPSLGGLGPRELLAPALFAGAGVSNLEAYTLSLLVFILQRLSSLLGGVWYVWSALRDGRKKDGASVSASVVDRV